MSDTGQKSDSAAANVIGLAALTHGAYSGVDLQPIWTGLLTRVRQDPYDAGAMMDIAVVLQLTGQKEKGLEAQKHALALGQVYARPGDPAGLKLLTFVTAGDFMANTPVDFLLEGTDTNLLDMYVGAGEPLPTVPDHEVAFVAIGESDDSRAVLDGLKPMLEVWPRPVLNRNVEAIKTLGRDRIAKAFADASHVVAPPTSRLSRADLERLAAGEASLDPEFTAPSYPVIVRPVGSHAGQNLELIGGAGALQSYVERTEGAEFFIAPFVEYAGADGLYRKFRIALIGGKPFISHMAVSEHWMVHYLNSGMGLDEAKREEERVAMETFDEVFVPRHQAAFDELNARIELDYYALDCAELPDGKLLLFEADVAMIVHSMDEPDLYPYKGPRMKALFKAFDELLHRAAGR